MSTAKLQGLDIDVSAFKRMPSYTSSHLIRATDFLSAIHSATGIDILALYSQHVTEQQAEAQVEGMKEGGDVFSATVTLEDGSLFGRRMALEELFQLFMGRMKEEYFGKPRCDFGKSSQVNIEDKIARSKVEQEKRDLGKVRINIMGPTGVL